MNRLSSISGSQTQTTDGRSATPLPVERSGRYPIQSQDTIENPNETQVGLVNTRDDSLESMKDTIQAQTRASIAEAKIEYIRLLGEHKDSILRWFIGLLVGSGITLLILYCSFIKSDINKSLVLPLKQQIDFIKSFLNIP
jgi:hypothetical protein